MMISIQPGLKNNLKSEIDIILLFIAQSYLELDLDIPEKLNTESRF